MIENLFILRSEILEEECFIHSYELPKELDVDFTEDAKHEKGVSLINYDQKNLVFKVKNKIIGDQLFAISNYIIISRKFADLLTEYVADKIELVPVTLVCKGKKNLDYFLLNPLTKKSPIDYENSKITKKSTGRIRKISELVTRLDNLVDIDIFRFEELMPRILISQGLKKIIEKSGIKGVLFDPLSKYQYPYKH